MTNGLTYVSPEKYHLNLLKGVLEHILHQYRLGILKYPEAVEIRVSLAYVLNDFALLKNEALTMAQFASKMETSISGAIKVRKLMKYLEEEDMYQDNTLTNASNDKKLVSNSGSEKGNIFIGSQSLDIKTYQKRMALKRKFFILRVMKSLSSYEDFWKELSLETPDSNKVRQYLAKYYSCFKSMKKFIKNNPEFLRNDNQAIFYYSIYQNLALGQVKESEQTLDRGRELIRKELKLKFDPKHVTLGLNLGEIDQPMLYAIRNGNTSIKVIECNLAFCWSLMLKKSDIKNKQLLDLVPKDLQTNYKNKLRTHLKKDTPQYDQFIFNYREHSIRKYSFYVKKLKS